MPKTRFAVYKTNSAPKYAMAYICTCKEPAIGYSDDQYGLFIGVCPNNHRSTVMAS
ncbi:hypothetical protein [Nonomuraea roseoviolacea]|uniref:Uncharacterized protein n=1 Tax=Nonomuraea roseoviolacea subsp. carminata TaxID=160689 RepID=A0ABT1JYW1_9ACTN|nr:hypothetical protein [Nonomuraea roseoviolacea]MCP2346933.1 hypothetical protein [Nonomuraea roseoviolacea subsp. carminata]